MAHEVKLTRVWCMPSKWTFHVKPIKDLLKRYDVGLGWIDPFCGELSPAEYRNDLNPNNSHAHHHLEALEFLLLKHQEIAGAIFDPPYSLTQVSRSYNDIFCISFGWNTCGLGKKNGMELIEVLVVCHGGNRNDTLVTVERKLQ